MNKYNYIVLGSDWDLYKFSYSDLYSLSNAKYIAGNFPPKKTLKGILYRMHFDQKINSKIKLPFKRIWNNSYFDTKFDTTRPLCFIVFNNWICLNIGIVDYLRRSYKGCKIVWICQDLISTQKLRYTNKPYDVEKIQRQFDLILSFDQNDCKKYGFVYHPLVFSSYNGQLQEMPYSDIYMLAQAKNRLGDILDIYEELRDKGLKIDFHIAGVKKQDRKYPDEIHYIDGKGLTYAENIQHILHTKCILEIMQKNGAGFTQRGCEAVCLGKKLLTNNEFIKSEPFFRSNYISTFKSPKDIDMDFLKHIPDNVDVDFNYKEKMSPVELLDFIEKRL